jgi:type II secretory pathway component PulF
MMDLETLKIAALKIQFNASQRMRVYRKLAGLIRNNVSRTEALDRLWEHASDDGRKPDDAIAVILNEWRRAERNGEVAFCHAVRRWVPSNEYALLQSGIVVGRIEQALDNVILITEGSLKLKRTIYAQLGYPVVLIIAATVLFWYISQTLVPIFDQPGMAQHWTGTARLLITASVAVRDWALVFLTSLLVLLAALIVALPRWTGAKRVIADRIFPFSLYRVFHGSSFLLAFSAMLAAGEQQHVILRAMQQTANPWLRERLRQTQFFIAQGVTNIGDALHRTKMGFPDKEIIGDLRTYAALPNFDDILNDLAHQWLEDGLRKVTEQTNYLKYGAMVFVALVILVGYLGFYDIIGQFQSQMYGR